MDCDAFTNLFYLSDTITTAIDVSVLAGRSVLLFLLYCFLLWLWLILTIVLRFADHLHLFFLYLLLLQYYDLLGGLTHILFGDLMLPILLLCGLLNDLRLLLLGLLLEIHIILLLHPKRLLLVLFRKGFVLRRLHS